MLIRIEEKWMGPNVREEWTRRCQNHDELEERRGCFEDQREEDEVGGQEERMYSGFDPWSELVLGYIYPERIPR